ncbi:hypothetical protein FEM48_Zijuj05G0103900 [Ziziphus jujuba var. spinosa]|uniref:Uncharacterized protein n=1 Tax=Ziziphus jujuba var. spinosa TaxID=714518 RepID=A0A978VEE8_ZIZJJ|nr:hypothetical protein FEM48_Zijuj05G0103900 [Ziziphus jujuba var. spinosa]
MGFISSLLACLAHRWGRGKHGGSESGGGGGGGGVDQADEGVDFSWNLFFELRTLQIATSFFSDLNKLGHGGFGPVYKSWKLYQGGRAMELVDPTLTKCNRDEAAMCIQLGLLCCQSIVSDRPDMNSIHLMLSSDSFTLPRPGKPGIQGRTGRWTTTTTSAFTSTNASTAYTGNTKASAGSSFVEDYSRNSISFSSIDEGR